MQGSSTRSYVQGGTNSARSSHQVRLPGERECVLETEKESVTETDKQTERGMNSARPCWSSVRLFSALRLYVKSCFDQKKRKKRKTTNSTSATAQPWETTHSPKRRAQLHKHTHKHNPHLSNRRNTTFLCDVLCIIHAKQDFSDERTGGEQSKTKRHLLFIYFICSYIYICCNHWWTYYFVSVFAVLFFPYI